MSLEAHQSDGQALLVKKRQPGVLAALQSDGQGFVGDEESSQSWLFRVMARLCW